MRVLPHASGTAIRHNTQILMPHKVTLHAETNQTGDKYESERLRYIEINSVTTSRVEPASFRLVA
jgi:hypothetical protein